MLASTNRVVVIALTLLIIPCPLLADDLATQFAQPPAAARPWVFWFWNNGNVTREGITADLEAMARVGVGGAIIMDVFERFAPPAGDADFMNAKWQELFAFAVSEANRLGLEINMTNGPGWCGSSGPWVTPELSMQRLVASQQTVEGPANFSAVLSRPDTTSDWPHDDFNSHVDVGSYYRDVVVLAVPETPTGVVEPEAVVDLTSRLDSDGKLTWDVPAGKWIVIRIGQTTTGASTRPPVKGGNGLEIDKLSREAMDLHFSHMMGRLIANVGSQAGPTLAATHIDSWEVGAQNWTPKFREEFQKRRGYDLTPYLPNVVSKNIRVGQDSAVERLLWDFKQTRAELLAENYVGRLAKLAHEHGLRLSIEGYHLPFGDEATYTAAADEPMTEFWSTGGLENDAMAREMASVAHTTGKPIVGAEAFTANENENWTFHPATVKALGDYELSQGVNRFVIHRFAHQPYLDRVPGATMGPWGLHYERTQTWWEMSAPWHRYLARCQYLLRQGAFVADLCFLRPETPDQTSFNPDPAPPAGYKYDECSAETLIRDARVNDGRLTFPDGMNYRVLVLPASRTMTPGLADAVKRLVDAGATVIGPRPDRSPSLTNYPQCDVDVARVGAEVWGDCDGKSVQEHSYGQGKLIWGRPIGDVLASLKVVPDFTADLALNWIHRRVDATDVYFVANPAAAAIEAKCLFRVSGARPELWNPESGECTPVAMYGETAEGVSVPLRLEASGSMFVVFRPHAEPYDPVVSFSYGGREVLKPRQLPVIELDSATYGVPGDPSRTRDVRTKVQTLLNGGEINFNVNQFAKDDDPAFGVVKTLELKYTIDGKPFTLRGRDPDYVDLCPSIYFTTGKGRDQGLKGEYFTNRELSGEPAAVRTDPGITFAWNSGSPAPGIPATNWSARWTGVLTPRETAEYTFSINADDGCRLVIDGKPVIDHWALDGGTIPHSGRIFLEAGKAYDVRVEYFQHEGNDQIHMNWLAPAADRPADVRQDAQAALEVVALRTGNYEIVTARGKTARAQIDQVPTPQEVIGPWDVRFPDGWGAPGSISLPRLSSLSESTVPGVKYFSGTANYKTDFDWNPPPATEHRETEVFLDLGDVQVMAHVTLNGHDLGVLWKPPYRVDITGVVRSGPNKLELRVADLWPNRMIGDHAPDAKKRFTWSSYDPFTADSVLPRSGLIGPVQIRTAVIAPLQ